MSAIELDSVDDKKHQTPKSIATRKSILDATVILQYSAGLIEEVLCPDLADINGDGHVDSVDSTIILQIVAGLLEK